MTAPLPGDLIFYRPRSLVDAAIKLGQSFDPTSRQYASYTHVAVAVSPVEIVESVGGGVRRSTNLDLAHGVCTGSRLLHSEQRTGVIQFALSHIGAEYDYLDYPDIALRLLLGHGLPWYDSDAYTCSEFAAACYIAVNALPTLTWARSVKPADLALAVNAPLP